MSPVFILEEFKNILKKLRRRSTIGARGSPENDSLIRYIARQRRMKVQETLSQVSVMELRIGTLNFFFFFDRMQKMFQVKMINIWDAKLQMTAR